MSREYIDSMVRRRIGLDALRRLRRLVDADRASEAANVRWAGRLTVVFIILLALATLAIYLAL
ncbi:MAG: hypothetical protein HZC23_10360 [Rhodocyclales bacterium]|nr:hypothetical protein [Rhodocyclales bacterium]